ncbi:MAG: DUF4382 domain-containing protein [Nanoarchaeota archaeon]|nr:DUF4382 domain-containing protein [Nanoarchaeota archaeon]
MKHKLLMILVIVSLALLLGCVPQQVPEETPEGTGVEEGRVVFTITDAAANMSAVTSIMVTVDSVQVHSAEKGWVTVSSEQKTYDLLQLKAEASHGLLADVMLEEGTYQQVRLDISNVVVVDAAGEHEAKLPSGELKIVGDLVVTADSTSTASFDFIADESLHVTGQGEYILAPVVQLETREDAEVDLKADSKVEIKNGRVRANVKVGMDAEGNVGIGLGISAKANVSISQGKIKVDIGIGKGKKEMDDNADAEADVEVGIGY